MSCIFSSLERPRSSLPVQKFFGQHRALCRLHGHFAHRIAARFVKDALLFFVLHLARLCLPGAQRALRHFVPRRYR